MCEEGVRCGGPMLSHLARLDAWEERACWLDAVVRRPVESRLDYVRLKGQIVGGASRLGPGGGVADAPGIWPRHPSTRALRRRLRTRGDLGQEQRCCVQNTEGKNSPREGRECAPKIGDGIV